MKRKLTKQLLFRIGALLSEMFQDYSRILGVTEHSTVTLDKTFDRDCTVLEPDEVVERKEDDRGSR